MVSMHPMVVWNTVNIVPGGKYATMDGTTTMPRSSVASLDTPLMVRKTMWAKNFHNKYYQNPDALAADGFPGGEDKPGFLSEVSCSGNEEKLELCQYKGPKQSCDAAGVTCDKRKGGCKLMYY